MWTRTLWGIVLLTVSYCLAQTGSNTGPISSTLCAPFYVYQIKDLNATLLPSYCENLRKGLTYLGTTPVFGDPYVLPAGQVCDSTGIAHSCSTGWYREFTNNCTKCSCRVNSAEGSCFFCEVVCTLPPPTPTPVCKFNGLEYKIDQSWTVDNCKYCTCTSTSAGPQPSCRDICVRDCTAGYPNGTQVVWPSNTTLVIGCKKCFCNQGYSTCEFFPNGDCPCPTCLDFKNVSHNCNEVFPAAGECEECTCTPTGRYCYRKTINVPASCLPAGTTTIYCTSSLTGVKYKVGENVTAGCTRCFCGVSSALNINTGVETCVQVNTLATCKLDNVAPKCVRFDGEQFAVGVTDVRLCESCTCTFYKEKNVSAFDCRPNDSCLPKECPYGNTTVPLGTSYINREKCATCTCQLNLNNRPEWVCPYDTTVAATCVNYDNALYCLISGRKIPLGTFTNEKGELCKCYEISPGITDLKCESIQTSKCPFGTTFLSVGGQGIVDCATCVCQLQNNLPFLNCTRRDCSPKCFFNNQSYAIGDPSPLTRDTCQCTCIEYSAKTDSGVLVPAARWDCSTCEISKPCTSTSGTIVKSGEKITSNGCLCECLKDGQWACEVSGGFVKNAINACPTTEAYCRLGNLVAKPKEEVRDGCKTCTCVDPGNTALAGGGFNCVPTNPLPTSCQVFTGCVVRVQFPEGVKVFTYEDGQSVSLVHGCQQCRCEKGTFSCTTPIEWNSATYCCPVDGSVDETVPLESTRLDPLGCGVKQICSKTNSLVAEWLPAVTSCTSKTCAATDNTLNVIRRNGEVWENKECQNCTCKESTVSCIGSCRIRDSQVKLSFKCDTPYPKEATIKKILTEISNTFYIEGIDVNRTLLNFEAVLRLKFKSAGTTVTVDAIRKLASEYRERILEFLKNEGFRCETDAKTETSAQVEVVSPGFLIDETYSQETVSVSSGSVAAFSMFLGFAVISLIVQ